MKANNSFMTRQQYRRMKDQHHPFYNKLNKLHQRKRRVVNPAVREAKIKRLAKRLDKIIAIIILLIVVVYLILFFVNF